MRLFQRIKHDLQAGWANLRYGAAQAANRAMAETELLQLRLELRKLDERLNDLLRDIGERAVELHGRGSNPDQVLADFEIARGAEQAEALKLQRSKVVAEMDDLRAS